MKDIIYYPGFEIEDENWMKFALLYLDSISPIHPNNIMRSGNVFSDKFSYIMEETDLIKAYTPKESECGLASIYACEEIEKYLKSPDRYSCYFENEGHDDFIDKWKNKFFQNSTIFSQKYTCTFLDFCVDNNLANICDEGIQVSKDIAFIYMNILADTISKRNGYEMITDEEKYSQLLLDRTTKYYQDKSFNLDLVKSEIELIIPDNLENIPIEKFVQLRNSETFKEARNAYIKEIEKASLDKGFRNKFDYDNVLSWEREFVDITKEIFNLSARVILGVYSFCSFSSEGKELLPALIGGAMGINDIKDEWENIGHIVKDIKNKKLARRYVADLSNIGK